MTAHDRQSAERMLGITLVTASAAVFGLAGVLTKARGSSRRLRQACSVRPRYPLPPCSAGSSGRNPAGSQARRRCDRACRGFFSCRPGLDEGSTAADSLTHSTKYPGPSGTLLPAARSLVGRVHHPPSPSPVQPLLKAGLPPAFFFAQAKTPPTFLECPLGE